MYLPLWFRGEGAHSNAEEGVGGVPIPTRGHKLWYSMNIRMYFVIEPLYNEVNQATVSHLAGMVQQASRSDLLLQYSMQRSPHFSTKKLNGTVSPFPIQYTVYYYFLCRSKSEDTDLLLGGTIVDTGTSKS